MGKKQRRLCEFIGAVLSAHPTARLSVENGRWFVTVGDGWLIGKRCASPYAAWKSAAGK